MKCLLFQNLIKFNMIKTEYRVETLTEEDCITLNNTFKSIVDFRLLDAVVHPIAYGFRKITFDAIINGKKIRFMNHFGNSEIDFEVFDFGNNPSRELWIFCLCKFKKSILEEVSN